MRTAALISTLALFAGTTVTLAQVTGAPVSPSGIATCAALRWHNDGGSLRDRLRARAPLPRPAPKERSNGAGESEGAARRLKA
jgi:hypothetical protein